MNPFSPDYQGRIAAESVTPKGKALARASQRASANIQALRESNDPQKRLIGSGRVPGLGMPADPAKAGAILKASQL